jgi:hypothetical protein
LKHKIVQGEVIKIGAHEVTPEAEVIVWQKKDAIIGNGSSVPIRGVSFTQVRPTALLDRSGGAERRIKIIDRNRQIELILLIAAILLPIVLNGLVALLGRNRSK